MTPSEQCRDIVKTFALLASPGSVVEMRALKVGRYRNTAAGYFDSSSEAAFLKAVQQCAADNPQAIYATLNPVHPNLLARYANRLEMRADATTNDDNILRRRFILVDADAVREAQISSDAYQHRAALERATACRDMLRDEHGIASVLADSGNGGHVLIPIDLPNDEESKTLVVRVLAALALRFTDDVVSIDQSVFNAARISKVYGTLARKGDNVPERPHRFARLLDVPAELPPASLETLLAIAGPEAPKPAAQAPRASTSHSAGSPAPFDLRAFIANSGLEIRNESNGKGDWHHWNLERCPFNPDHRYPDSIIAQNSAGAITFKCQHNTCSSYGWHDLRQKFEPTWAPYDPNRPAPGRRLSAADPRPMQARSAAVSPSPDGPGDEDQEWIAQRRLDAELCHYRQNDVGNAQRLVARYGPDLRYDFTTNKWFIWDGKRFRPDDDGKIMRLAMATAESIHAEVTAIEHSDEKERAQKQRTHSNFAQRTQSKQNLSNMEQIARVMLPVNSEQMDADPMVLPVANGLLDLRTGTLRPHDRAALNTKCVDIMFDPDAKCPEWEWFVSWAMAGDVDTIQFLQRAAGYALTGETYERALFFILGEGRNGKSTFVDIIQKLLGGDKGYWQKIDAKSLGHVFNVSGSAPNSDIAKLHDARLVTVSEMPQGARLNEALIKDLTGGRDTITARFLNKEPFTFQPRFKIWWYGNHKPTIKGTDTGIWSRFRLIPFTQQVSEEERDGQLPVRLEKELPGILAWAVRGCLDWQKNGLGNPEIVRTATEDFRNEEDVIGQFISDLCEVGPQCREVPAHLRKAYEIWCTANTQTPIHENMFGKALEGRGFHSTTVRDGKRVVRMRQGLHLLEESEGVTDSEGVTGCNRVSTGLPFMSRTATNTPEKSVTTRYKEKSLLQTDSGEQNSSDMAPELLPFADVITAAKQNSIPVRKVRVGTGHSADLNNWVKKQVRRFSLGVQNESEDEQDAAIAELHLCLEAWQAMEGGANG